jgi:transcriptional regulator with XRE-family HTH domain
MTMQDQVDAEMDLELGLRIRARRTELNMTLQDLAVRTGLTASFISQVERGLAATSLRSLRKIAGTLEVSMFYLLDERTTQSRVVRSDERITLSPPNSEFDLQLLVPSTNLKMEAFVGIIGPETGNQAMLNLNEPTEEFMFVLKGRLEIGLSEGKYTLKEGDSIYFEGHELKSITNASVSTPAEWVSVITPPVF